MAQTSIDTVRNRIRADVEAVGAEAVQLSQQLHLNPELGFEETSSVALLADCLESVGFKVETGLWGLSTSLRASLGEGPLTIAIMAEYDALPGVGHACGHNIIAATAYAVAGGMREVLGTLGVRLVILGAPAEESGGGKQLIAERGAFEGIHAAMMVHPARTDVLMPTVMAIAGLGVEYKGRAAHAAACPEMGINAADALTVAQVAVGLLRQQCSPTDRIHGIVTAGGDAPNVIPDLVRGSFMVRTSEAEQLDQLVGRVRNCLEAGALATGASVEITESMPRYANMRHNGDMALYYQRNAQGLGREFDDSDGRKSGIVISTDMGNVSHLIPSIHPMIGIGGDSSNHELEFAERCGGPAAEKAILDGAIALSWTIVDIAQDENLREAFLQGFARSGNVQDIAPSA